MLQLLERMITEFVFRMGLSPKSVPFYDIVVLLPWNISYISFYPI